MASAPPLESAGLQGHLLLPPSYEEAMGAPSPQYPQGPVLPPAYAKAAQLPYPTTETHSPMYPPPPVHNAVTRPIVSVQTVYVQHGLVYGDIPVQTHCPACAQMVITCLEHTSGTITWLSCAGLFIFGCVYGCCLIPFCVDGLKDVTHRCPTCRNVLGVYKRL